MLGCRRGVEAGLRDPWSPLRAPPLALNTPRSRLLRAELGDRGQCGEMEEWGEGFEEGRESGGRRAGWEG